MVQSLGHGGCERDAAKIAMGLDRDRFEVHVGVLRQGGFRVPEVIAAGVPVVHFPLESLMNWSLVRASQAMGSYLRANQIKLVHCFDPPTDIFGAPNVRLNRVPFLLTSQLSFRELCLPRERALLKVTDRLSNYVVVNSQAVGESLVQQDKLPREKLYLCYNGVDTTIFFPKAVPRPESVRNASVVFGSVCVMRPEKRMDWVIRSFNEVTVIDPEARLLLVGSGPEVGPLQNLASELGIRNKCLFIPGQAEVADWLRSIDVYINSSRSESFPNALLEAMACGCCVVGSEVGGIPELIKDRENGLTFPVGEQSRLTEALKMVATDSSLRNQLREAAAKTAKEKFSLQHNLDRMQSLYSSLIESRNGS